MEDGEWGTAAYVLFLIGYGARQHAISRRGWELKIGERDLVASLL
jgi:hypothetical protein